MKKILLLSAALFMSVSALFADEISKSQAESIAKSFFGSSKATFVWDGTDGATKSATDQAPAFYVFNNPAGGWVIVSGDDATVDVIGYSAEGSFRTEAMPSNIRYWLDGTAEAIRDARASGLAKTPSSARPRTIARASTNSKELKTATWDQESPYNMYCPTIKGESKTSMTGCVATAMSIVLRYQRWPEKGKGKTKAYNVYASTSDGLDYDYSKVVYSMPEVDIDGHVYNWDNMPTDGSKASSWTTAQKQEVATLMYHCGAMVEMLYSYKYGSGASSSAVKPALAEHMYYSKSAKYYSRNMFSTAEWMQMIKTDIDADRPVIYGGADLSNGGHEFVIDGYDMSNSKVHVNWGWSGSDNGWFTLDLKIGSSYKFDSYQSAIFGLVPDPDGTSQESAPALTLEYYGQYQGYSQYKYKGLELSSGKVEKGQSVTFSLGTIVNDNGVDYSGKAKISLVGHNGQVKQDIVTQSFSIKDGYLYYFDKLTGTISADVSFGDKIVAYYSYGSEWIPFYYDHETSGVSNTVAAGGSYIDVATHCQAGSAVVLTFMSSKKISSTTWYVDDARVSATSFTPAAGTHTIKAVVKYSDGSTETFVQKILAQ